ncbi:ROK family protein [Streptomyces sp. NPDC059567]|uniref:ROK family transcriptional regulator n=1 Tax=Streptomyces sp. NPDC059567 TaxID=3346867 RepID=UPI0036AF55AD
MTGTAGAASVAGVNLPALRSHNAALVLDLLRTAGEAGISRLELADRTGLTPQAVSKITARLRAEGLAREAGHRASTGGKPRTVLRLVPSAAYAVGVHLDRDELTAVLVDLAGVRVAVRRAPLDLGAGASAVFEVVEREVDALRRVGAAGVGVGGGGIGAGGSVASVGSGAGGGIGGGASGAGGSVGSVGSGAGGGVGGGLSGAGGSVASVGSGAQGPGTSGAGIAATPEREALETAGSETAGSETAGSEAAPGPDTSAPALLGVGVAMPGPLDHLTGTPGRVTGYPEWEDVPLRDELARRLGLPVELDKDTNTAALGLALRAPVADSFAYLHLGTGLGSGLVLGGALHRGARTGAGEFGHQTVQLDGPPCDCGGRGCMEVLCLGAVARGDLPEAARILGTGAMNLVRLLDIDRVVLGGRAVTAAPEVFVHGVGAVLADAGLGTPVAGTATPYAVAEGAAQLILSPIFGK